MRILPRVFIKGEFLPSVLKAPSRDRDNNLSSSIEYTYQDAPEIFLRRSGIMLIAIVTVVMIFSIPIIAILTDHIQKNAKYKQSMLKDELELEKLKHENFVIETEKMKLELEKMKLDRPKDKTEIL
jgi:hypothetical protein